VDLEKKRQKIDRTGKGNRLNAQFCLEKKGHEHSDTAQSLTLSTSPFLSGNSARHKREGVLN
jgi:hypothetical protein